MAEKKNPNEGYETLRKALKAKTPARAYVFYGKERYLLHYCLDTLRAMVAKGTETFNDRRLSGKTLTLQELRDAVDTPPLFSDFVLVEVEDFDFARTDEATRTELVRLLSDVPEYMTFVFQPPGEEFKLDGRLKGNKELRALLTEVSFNRQEGQDIVRWITRNCAAGGKAIDRDTAAYLATYTDGLMTTMKGEIGKLCAYVQGPQITRADIAAVCIPNPEAATYELTDAILGGKWPLAAEKLADLVKCEIPAHVILFALGAKARQLLAACVLRQAGRPMEELKTAADIRYDFQAREVYKLAARFPLERAKAWVNCVADTALALNSGGGEDTELLAELLVRLREASL